MTQLSKSEGETLGFQCTYIIFALQARGEIALLRARWIIDNQFIEQHQVTFEQEVTASGCGISDA
jgi:hypothetical protein